jgi:hypothetical protein
MVETGEAALNGELAARLAELRIDPEEYRIEVGDRTVEAPDPIAFRAQLTSALYEVWHAGITAHATALPVQWRDRAFEDDLAAGVPHRGTATPARLCPRPDGVDPAQAVVEVNRVRLLVPAEAVSGRTPGDEVVLDLPAVRPLLSPGFLVATGAAGGGSGGKAVLRLYVHLQAPEHAPAVWRTALEVLESRGARYRAKVLSRRARYPRRDALVVYLPQESRRHVPDLVGALDGLAGVGGATSMLARPIRPGLAMAWEPADDRPGWRRVSFGQHRAMAVARGVVRHMGEGVELHEAVAGELTAAGVDPAEPARNLDSPDFPHVGASGGVRDPGACAAPETTGLAAVPA